MAGGRSVPACCGPAAGTRLSRYKPSNWRHCAMDVIDLLGDIGRVLLRTFVVIAPLLAWQFIALGARPLRRRAGGLADPTIIAGTMVGIAILAVILPMDALNWDAIVTAGGFWNLSLWQFVDLARSIVLHGPGALLA